MIAITATMPDTAMARATETAADDATLARAAAHGDAISFESLYRRHCARIHGVLLRLAGYRRDRAEDWLQEAFLQAWQQLPSFRHQSAFGTWMHRLAVNTALMALRREQARPLAIADPAHLPDVAMDPTCPAEQQALIRAIAALPPRARTVLVLHDVEGWRHREIGKALGVAAGTSKAQLHRARGLLREVLGEAP